MWTFNFMSQSYIANLQGPPPFFRWFLNCTRCLDGILQVYVRVLGPVIVVHCFCFVFVSVFGYHCHVNNRSCSTTVFPNGIFDWFRSTNLFSSDPTASVSILSVSVFCLDPILWAFMLIFDHFHLQCNILSFIILFWWLELL